MNKLLFLLLLALVIPLAGWGDEVLVDSLGIGNGSEYEWIIDIYPASGSVWGQTFNCSQNASISRVQFYLEKYESPAANISCRLYAVTGDYGNTTIPLGNSLSNSSVINTTTLTGSFVLYNFTFANGYNMTEGTKYAIALQADNGVIDFSNYVQVGSSDNFGAGNNTVHNGNGIVFQGDPAEWMADYGVDLIFYVYGTTGGAPPAAADDSQVFIISKANYKLNGEAVN